MVRFVVTVGLAAVVMGPWAARAQEHPWCAAVQTMSGLAENCGFASYQQCTANVSGIGGYCYENPRHRPNQASERRQRRDR